MNAYRLALLTVSFILIAGCDRTEENLPKVKEAREAVAAAGTSPAGHLSKKDFMESSRAELDKLQQDLDALKEKMEKASSDEKEKIKFELERFQHKQSDLENEWRSFREDGSNAWHAFEKSFKKSIEDLRNAIREFNFIRK